MEADSARFSRSFWTTWQSSAIWIVISLCWGINAVRNHAGWLGLVSGIVLLGSSVFHLFETIRRFRAARSAKTEIHPLEGIEL
jgi:hypothetical protein